MRLAILVLAAVALTACHPDEKSAIDKTATSADAQSGVAENSSLGRPAAAAPADSAPVVGIQIANVTIAPGFKYTLRYDRIRQTTNTKRDQRQILVEAEVANGSEAMAGVVAALAKVGYTPGKEKHQYGGVRVRFRRKGHPEIYVLVRESGSGPKIRNSNSNATVYFTQLL